MIESIFLKKVDKLLKSDFGTVENVEKYLVKVLTNEYLMGKKPMADGTVFKLHPGSLFMPKLLQAWVENSWIFNVYPPKKPLPFNKPAEKQPSRQGVMDEAAARFPGIAPEILNTMVGTMGETSFSSWVMSTTMMNSSGILTIGTPSDYFRDYLNQTFKYKLLTSLKPLGIERIEVILKDVGVIAKVELMV